MFGGDALRYLIPFIVLLLFGAIATASTAQTPPPIWEDVTPSMPTGTAPLMVAADPAHPGTVYFGTGGANFQGAGIWKSTNYGSPGSWARVDVAFAGPCGNVQMNGLNWALAVDDIGYVYTTNGYGCAQGLFRSTDGGVHWAPMNIGGTDPDIGHIAIDPYLPGHILASFHSDHTCECAHASIESFDRGVTWHPVTAVAGGHNNWIHFLNNSTTWIQSSDGAGIYRTTNSGATWTLVSNVLPMHGNQEILHVGSAFYLGSAQGVLRSLDNGASWQLVMPTGNSDGLYAVGIDAAGRMYTRSSNTGPTFTGPMRTSTDGTTWTNYNSQTWQSGPSTFASDAQYVYTVMWTGQLLRLPQPGGPPPATPTPVPATATVPPASTPTPVPPTPTPSAVLCYEAYYLGNVLTKGPARACP